MEGANFPTVDRIIPITTPREAKTLVLFGRVGNGKSALGNSIFGKKVFDSRISAGGVTTTCKLETTTLDDGQVVNVIDTPGLFDTSRGHEYYTYEMVKCINLAKGGIDGFIFVCSIKTRFSIEEEDAIKTLRDIFGEEITNYMIIVFTGGDQLETTFPEYISTSPPSLQRVLRLCKNRIVLFDNRTKDETQRKHQVQQLMKYIGMIGDESYGKSYTGDIFEMMKREALFKEEDQQRINYEAQQRQLHIQRIHEAANNSMNYGAQLIQFDHPGGSSRDETSSWGKNDEGMLREKITEVQKLYQQEKAKNEKMEMDSETIKPQTDKDRLAEIAGDVIKTVFTAVALAGACTIM